MNDHSCSELDLRVEELEVLVGPYCAPGPTPAECDFYTAVGVSASFVSITVVIT